MQAVDEKIETIHLYVVREEEPRPVIVPQLILAVFGLAVVALIGIYTALNPPYVYATIRLPVRTVTRAFSATVPVIPTGVKIYPATTAHGLLTVTNGSVISQTLPAGVILVSNSGVSVTTDQAVFVPAGNANGYGYATTAAHVSITGEQGNIPTLAINTVEGSSVYIRNLLPFRGGTNQHSVTYTTMQDKQTAFIKARDILAVESSGLHYPCSETVAGNLKVMWHCPFITYRVPAGMSVLHMQFIGKSLFATIRYIYHPTIVRTR